MKSEKKKDKSEKRDEARFPFAFRILIEKLLRFGAFFDMI